MSGKDTGLSEVAGEILIIFMLLVLAVVVIMLVSGVFPLSEKTAYLVPEFSVTSASGNSVIRVFNRGGDPVSFTGSPQARYKAELYVDTDAGTFRAVPVPSLEAFRPGDTLYAYYTGSGFVLTDALPGGAFPSLPEGKIAITFIDVTSGVLIKKEELVPGMVTMIPTVTTSTTTPPATTTTTTSTTTTTTATPTPKMTCPPGNPHCGDCPGPWPWC